jgi:cold shock CspA family protein
MACRVKHESKFRPRPSVNDEAVQSLTKLERQLKKQWGSKRPQLKTGTVSHADAIRHFGFILDDEKEESVYIPARELLPRLKKGDRVTFEAIQGSRGLVAVNIKLV